MGEGEKGVKTDGLTQNIFSREQSIFSTVNPSLYLPSHLQLISAMKQDLGISCESSNVMSICMKSQVFFALNIFYKKLI